MWVGLDSFSAAGVDCSCHKMGRSFLTCPFLLANLMSNQPGCFQSTKSRSICSKDLPLVSGSTIQIKIKPARQIRPYNQNVLPVYYGTMAAEIKKLLDESVAHHGKLAGKIGGAFASSANVGGGNETTVMDLIKALLIHGMIVPGSAKGDHYGPVAIGKPDNRAQNECKKLGRLVATLTVKLYG